MQVRVVQNLNKGHVAIQDLKAKVLGYCDYVTLQDVTYRTNKSESHFIEGELMSCDNFRPFKGKAIDLSFKHAKPVGLGWVLTMTPKGFECLDGYMIKSSKRATIYDNGDIVVTGGK